MSQSRQVQEGEGRGSRQRPLCQVEEPGRCGMRRGLEWLEAEGAKGEDGGGWGHSRRRRLDLRSFTTAGE